MGLNRGLRDPVYHRSDSRRFHDDPRNPPGPPGAFLPPTTIAVSDTMGLELKSRNRASYRLAKGLAIENVRQTRPAFPGRIRRLPGLGAGAHSMLSPPSVGQFGQVARAFSSGVQAGSSECLYAANRGRGRGLELLLLFSAGRQPRAKGGLLPAVSVW